MDSFLNMSKYFGHIYVLKAGKQWLIKSLLQFLPKLQVIQQIGAVFTQTIWVRGYEQNEIVAFELNAHLQPAEYVPFHVWKPRAQP